MKLFVVLALCACAYAFPGETILDGGLERVEGREIIPPPPGFEIKGLTGLTGLTGVTTGLTGIEGREEIPKVLPTVGLTTEITRGSHYVDAPIYSSPPLSLVDHDRVKVVPTSSYYNHHGTNYVIVPPSRTQPLSSPLKNYLVGTPSSSQYVYSPTPVHSEVIPSTGYQYLYSPPSVHSGVIPTVGSSYVYGAPNLHTGLYNSLPIHTGSQYLYSPSVPLTGEHYTYSPSVPLTGEHYTYSPSVPLTGEHYTYSPANVNYYVPEVEHKEHPVLRAPTHSHPRNGASVYYAKWQ